MSNDFETELANMEHGGDEQMLLGEGPENQNTNIKWVILKHFTIQIDQFNMECG